MIQELKVKNFRSFKDEVVLSFEATKDTKLEDNYVVEVAPGVRLLRFAMVMGANGSGKSNLLLALDFLSQFWFLKTSDLDEDIEDCIPFLLDKDTKDAPTEFELRFWIKGVKYCYYLKLDQKQIYNERLNVYRSVQPTLVFSRELKNGHTIVTFNPAVEKVSEVAIEKIQLECLNNMSFFAARQKVNLPLTVIDEVRDWMQTAIRPIITPDIRMFGWAVGEMSEHKDVRDHLIEFLDSSDFNITDIISKEELKEAPDRVIELILANPRLPEDERERIRKERTLTAIDVTFKHKVENERGIEEYIIDEDCQSYGTRRTIGMEAAIYSATKEGGFLNIDEFDTSMHFDLCVYILSRFLSQKSESQMLVTTHSTPLLGELDKLIRKDSVWFTERGKDGASRLYTLVEFRGLNRMSSIQNAYLAGKFGAVPKIINNFGDAIEVQNINIGNVNITNND